MRRDVTVENHSFSVQRPPVLDMGQLERMEEAMLRILEDVGIAVPDEDLREQLRARGFRIGGTRVFIRRNVILEFLDSERKRNGDAFAEGSQPVDPSDDPIELSVSPYPQHCHDIQTDRVVPFDTERLIEATRLVDVLASEGVVSSPPGCPADVPPALQPILQFWVAATYSRQGRYPVDPKSAESLPFVMEMAEVIGSPLRHLPIYVFSPLTLGGESLRCVLEFEARLSSVHVGNMASLGCSAPIHAGDAFALCAAEAIGSAILVRELIELPVSWRIRLCPVDMASLAMALGTPEDLLLLFANAEVNAFFQGSRWRPEVASVHTSAKQPGAQACAEKSSLMTTGALLGARRLGGAGTLSLDEVFSPEQLLYDLEIRNHVQRVVQGLDGDCIPERCLEEVAEGVRQTNFAGHGSTLDAHRQVYWYPELFERRFLNAWMADDAPTIRHRAREKIQKLLRQHDYELDPAVRGELDRVLGDATARFSG